jgi:anti-anti-sigma regulatory factor
MEINVSKLTDPIELVILRPHGPIDASNYEQLVNEAHRVYDSGARYLVIDLSRTPYMSSSGIVALHTIALLMNSDFSALRSTDDQADIKGLKQYVKLVNPPARIVQLLEMAGFNRFIDSHPDLETAIASFQS